MTEFEDYIHGQKYAEKPLYQWDKYSGYLALKRAIRSLDEVTQEFEDVLLPEEYARMYRRRARTFSTAVSTSAIAALGVMNDQAATCIDDVEASNLGAEDKGDANTAVTGELAKVIKYLARATSRTWAAYDLLEERMKSDSPGEKKYLELAFIKKLILESRDQQRIPRKSWHRTATSLLLGASTITAVGIGAAYICGATGLNLSSMAWGHDHIMYGQVVNLVQRTLAVTNLTGQIYSVKLQDLDQRYIELESASEGHGLRIDNLVDALGPSNELGDYYSSPKAGCSVPDDLDQYFKKIADEINRQMQRVQSEMEQMRKNINRMDIRLTKRLDKVDRYKI